MKRINIGRSVQTNTAGFELFAKLYRDIHLSEEQEVLISFEQTKWFEANLTAVLGAVVHLLEKEGFSLQLADIDLKVKDILSRNGFLEYFSLSTGYTSPALFAPTYVSYQQFGVH